MNSSLLQSSQNCFEFGSMYNSNFSLNDSINLLENNEEENSMFFPLSKKTITENEYCQEKPFIGIENSGHINNYNSINNEIQDKNNDIYSQFNSINDFNDNCMNLNPNSILSTSNNSFSFPNFGVKNEEIILESDKDINENNKSDEKIFKCDFLEEISLSLDENLYFNNTKNKKNKLDLNDPTSLFAAIVNLMKERGPIESKTIISNLEDKKDIFRKANGSRYKQEFGKLIRTTLNKVPRTEA